MVNNSGYMDNAQFGQYIDSICVHDEESNVPYHVKFHDVGPDVRTVDCDLIVLDNLSEVTRNRRLLRQVLVVFGLVLALIPIVQSHDTITTAALLIASMILVSSAFFTFGRIAGITIDLKERTIETWSNKGRGEAYEDRTRKMQDSLDNFQTRF